MTKWTWFLALYLLAITASCFYSVYLASVANGIFNPSIMFTNRDTGSPINEDKGIKVSWKDGEEGDLMTKTRALITFYKYLSYALIVGNALVIISLFLLDFKISWRNDVAIPGLPAIGGRRR